MTNLKKTLCALGVAGALAWSASASAAPFGVNPPGATPSFTADEIIITSAGLANITLTDLPPPGLNTGDTFFEMGLVQAVDFGLNNFPLGSAITGLNSVGGYQLFATYNFGGVVVVLPTSLLAVMTFGSGNLVVDTNLLPGIQVPTSTNVGSLSLLPGNGTCDMPAVGLGEGTCEFNFNFTPAGTFWESGGAGGPPMGPTIMNVDINIDEIRFAGNPGTADGPANADNPGPGAGLAFNVNACLTNPLNGGVCKLTADHDGSARIPEPGSLALLGAALLGFVGLRRRKR